MSIRHTIALSATAAALALLAGCASAPRQSEPAAEQSAGAGEPDLVAQLRERMAAGTLQRQEKTEDKKPSAASDDTSRSPVMAADAMRQQAAMAVSADYSRAIALMNADQDAEALPLLQQISTRTPTFSGPVINQGVILLKQKKFADAEKVLRQALAINARNPYAHNLLGIALREQGKFADARAAYETALGIDPNYAKAHFNLGVLADLYLQDLPLALTHYERYQALQSKPDPAVAKWIIDLQKRTGVYKAPPPAPPAPEPAAAPADESGEAPATAPQSGGAPDATAPKENPAAAPAPASGA